MYKNMEYYFFSGFNIKEKTAESIFYNSLGRCKVRNNREITTFSEK